VLFNSIPYIYLFLPTVVVVAALLFRRDMADAGKLWLVGASLFFYGYWNPIYLWLIAGSIVVNFSLGRWIRTLPRHRRLLLVCGIFINLSLLGYYKYADFFLENISRLFEQPFGSLDLILPLAISFFTFQQIAYLVEDYRGETPAYGPLDYCFFVTFFPQLIAGPIVRHEQIMPQLASSRLGRTRERELFQGLALFGIGLFKKVVVADTFAIAANAGYAAEGLGFFDAWTTSLSYTFQLYYDFSGYSDMAIGAALLFGIRLPVNFDSPYKAASIQEFWRRWHITLSNWLRDYLYIPLGGNRSGAARAFANALITFLLGGLWHGAGWTFVVWGGLHGLAVGLHAVWHRLGLVIPRLPAAVLTFLFVNLAWVVFRAESMTEAVDLYKGMIGMNGVLFTVQGAEILNQLAGNPFFTFEGSASSGLSSAFTVQWILFWALVAFRAPNSLEIVGYRFEGDNPQPVSQYRLSCLAGIALGCGTVGLLVSSGTEFLYFNF